MPKSGTKQSVVRRVSSRKKKGFRGVQKQRLNTAKQPEVNITFVGDDDVVSERIPEPPVPVSSRKLKDFMCESGDSTSTSCDENEGFEEPKGYRLVSMDSLRKFVERIHNHQACASASVRLVEDTTRRFGLSSTIYAKCDCGLSEFLATGEHPDHDTTPRTVQGKDINRRAVYGAFEMGVGKEGIAKLCELLNMPFSMSADTWYNHEEALSIAHSTVTRKQLQENIIEARKIALQEQGLNENDQDTVVGIPVSFDGTWSKRGYTANHCISFVISATTGKVLDFEVISKTCSRCIQMKSRLNDDDFEQWLQLHECEGSYTGSSPSMEMECAKQLWSRSITKGIMYKWMISDGDSKSYHAVWNIYGACDTCTYYESLPKTSKEYLQWRDSDSYMVWQQEHLEGSSGCNRVMKLDCIGHVQKRLGKALYDFQSSAKKMDDGKPIKGRAGRLTKISIEKLKTYYGKAIRNNVNKGAITPGERSHSVELMQREIKAGLYHCLKIPEQERHKFCPKDSWCKYQKGLECPDKPHHLDATFRKPLEKIYDRLSEPALLARCLPGYTQNANESINSLVWNKCPKHKWHGRRRIVMAASAAALHFSCGATKKYSVMKEAGLSVSSATRKEGGRRDIKRVEQAEKRVQEQHKKYRLARRQARSRDEEQRINQEGISYEAGGFNEAELSEIPQKRKKQKKK